MDGKARSGLPSSPWRGKGRPAALKVWRRRPKFGSSSIAQITPMATGAMTRGAKMMVRITVEPRRIPWSISAAKTVPTPTWKTRLHRMKSTLFLIAIQNTGSEAIRR